ncbi:TetR family transcriptional regulator [Nocardia sp. SYP-A9097]|uniref:TetR/AcrR family transcriptional regulator n=1 Tax=Nocardia sp. SYP-A9097 TaxID=2663237 RepID=UPI00129B6179|nr:TetR/AcrR family transcriptional regulator [Nocardia sp. SYP-A9097]MRH87712.1 TetR family transcriptional regulator [Nocardia sp. SYP-A9097]
MARPPLGRQQLLDAARAELVAANGVVDLNSLKRRSGLSTGALYHHFGSKAGLLVAIYEEFHAGLVAAVADETIANEQGWAARERARTRNFVEYHFGDPLAELLLGRISTEPEVAEVEAATLERIIESAGRNIRTGQESGELDPGIDPDLAGACVMGALRHGMAEQLRRHPRPTIDAATEGLWRFIAAAVGVNAGSTPAPL